MTRKKAIVFGASGQDASYLMELLLAKDYEVIGVIRRSSTSNTSRIDHIKDKITLASADLLDQNSIDAVIKEHGVDGAEVYNLAAQSFVPASFSQPEFTAQATGVGAIRILESIKKNCPSARFYQAGSSEMFGNPEYRPQNEHTPFRPRSPYACAKVFANHATVNYREAYGLFAVNGICFNHESPRRGPEFVTQKIATAAARIKQGKQSHLRLGNLEAKRDWGFAGDYVEAMWLLLNQPEPRDYVIGAGSAHSVRDFTKTAFDAVDLSWEEHVVIDRELFRPSEVNYLLSDPTSIQENLGWKATTSFEQLVTDMVEARLRD